MCPIPGCNDPWPARPSATLRALIKRKDTKQACRYVSMELQARERGWPLQPDFSSVQTRLQDLRPTLAATLLDAPTLKTSPIWTRLAEQVPDLSRFTSHVGLQYAHSELAGTG
jgi:hypothetical protein